MKRDCISRLEIKQSFPIESINLYTISSRNERRLAIDSPLKLAYHLPLTALASKMLHGRRYFFMARS